MTHFFEIDNLTFSHPMGGEERPPALKDVSFRVFEGEWIALIAPMAPVRPPGSPPEWFHPNPWPLCLSTDWILLSLLIYPRSDHWWGWSFNPRQFSSRCDTAFWPENMALPQDEIQSRVEAALREGCGNVGSPRSAPICSPPVKFRGWRWPTFIVWPLHYFR